MRKSIIILIAVLSVAAGAQAQWHVSTGLEGKVITDGDEATVLGGWYFGGGYHFRLGEVVGLTLDGAVSNVTSTESDYVLYGHTYYYNYSETLAHLPLLLDFRLPLGQRHGLHIFAGPSLSYAITSARHEWRDDDSPETYLNRYSSDEVPSNELLRRWNASVMAGVAARLGWLSLTAGVRVPLMNRLDDGDGSEHAASLFLGAGVVF